MSLTSVSTPLKDVGQDSLLTVMQSAWVALHNPIIWKYIRKDFVMVDVVVSGEKATVTFNSPDAYKFSLIETGDLFYISNATVTGTFVVEHTSGSDQIVIFLDGAGYANGTYNLGYANNNSLAGYRIEAEILTFTDDPTDDAVLAVTDWQPFTDGTLTIDISSWLKRELTMRDGFDYTTDYANDEFAWGGFHFKVRERFTDEYDEPSWISDTTDYYWVNAVKQLQDQYGQNMAKYVPFYSTDGGWYAKFLTKFVNPVYFPGLPFDLSCIVSEKLVSLNLEFSFANYDVNGTVFGFGVNTDITNDVGVTRLNVAGLINDDQYSATIYLKEDGTSQRFTEIKRILISHECIDFPIYLKWMNSLGGWSYWCFKFDQQKSLATGDAITMQKVVEDLEDADALLETISKSGVPRLVAGANDVSSANLRGLKELLTSPKVYCLMNPDSWTTGGEDEDGDPLNPWPDAYLSSDIQPKWQIVNIPTGSFPLESTRRDAGGVEVTIQFQEILIQAQ